MRQQAINLRPVKRPAAKLHLLNAAAGGLIVNHDDNLGICRRHVIRITGKIHGDQVAVVNKPSKGCGLIEINPRELEDVSRAATGVLDQHKCIRVDFIPICAAATHKPGLLPGVANKSVIATQAVKNTVRSANKCIGV